MAARPLLPAFALSAAALTGAPLLALPSGCGHDPGGLPLSRVQEAWDPNNAPSRLEWNAERDFSKLPLQARSAILPWSDTYWPTHRGGLAWRWAGNGAGFDYTLLTKEQLASFRREQLADLSPAEKYDILMGRYDYPLVKAEWRRTNPQAESWEGLCHGWAPASINYREPEPITFTNSDGIKVPFGSSDVKALLILYHGEAFTPHPPRRFLGLRCEEDLARSPGSGTSPECRDTNAGSFHVLLAHYVGKLKVPLVADITRDAEVWNHPIYSYESRIINVTPPSQGAAPGTVREVWLRTKIDYVREGNPRWGTNLGTTYNLTGSDEYRYRVELDADDRIIGGEWGTSARPDFLWVQKRPAFSGYYKRLGELYEAATSGGAP